MLSAVRKMGKPDFEKKKDLIQITHLIFTLWRDISLLRQRLGCAALVCRDVVSLQKVLVSENKVSQVWLLALAISSD